MTKLFIKEKKIKLNQSPVKVKGRTYAFIKYFGPYDFLADKNESQVKLIKDWASKNSINIDHFHNGSIFDLLLKLKPDDAIVVSSITNLLPFGDDYSTEIMYSLWKYHIQVIPAIWHLDRQLIPEKYLRSGARRRRRDVFKYLKTVVFEEYIAEGLCSWE